MVQLSYKDDPLCPSWYIIYLWFQGLKDRQGSLAIPKPIDSYPDTTCDFRSWIRIWQDDPAGSNIRPQNYHKLNIRPQNYHKFNIRPPNNHKLNIRPQNDYKLKKFSTNWWLCWVRSRLKRIITFKYMLIMIYYCTVYTVHLVYVQECLPVVQIWCLTYIRYRQFPPVTQAYVDKCCHYSLYCKISYCR